MESVLFQKMRPVGWCIDTVDTLLAPFLYLPSGIFFDLPRRSYFWNRRKLASHEAARLRFTQMVSCEGDPFAISHLSMLREPRKKYVVLDPELPTVWYLGWVTADNRFSEVSRIPLEGQIRSTVGIRNLHFFALNPQGHQIALTKAGEGIIGDQQEDFEKIPLID